MIVTLNTSQSKRLIAKSIAKLPEVQKAYKDGIIGLPLCTTNAYVYDELSGHKMENPETYCCGHIVDRGFCLTNKKDISLEIVLIKGVENYIKFPEANLSSYINKMTSQDIIIKSGNILDINKKAGVLVGEPNGGEYGEILPYVLSRGIKFIIPMTLNKTALIKIEDILNESGLSEISIDDNTRMPCAVMPMFGKVITEVDAFEILANSYAIPIAMSGIGSGEGCTTFLIKGNDNEIKIVHEILKDLKKEKKLIPRPNNCLECVKTEGEFICPQGRQVINKFNSKTN